MHFLALDRRGCAGLAALLLAASLLYLATLQNGLTPGNLEGGDLITHQYAQVQGRPANAPGYPLYSMGGWLWFHGLRLLAADANPNPIPILSSYSTLWGIGVLGLFYLLLYGLTRGNLAISLGLSAFYAVTYFFWYYSVTTEQYTSAVLHTLAIVAAALAWDHRPGHRPLYVLAFLLGLALAHMVTVLFVAPGVLLYLLYQQPGLLRQGRLIGRAIVLALTPLLSYVYVYVRGAQYPEWRGAGEWPSAWAWFLDFVSTQQGRDELTWTLGPFTAEFPRLIWVELTPLLLVLGLVGWALMGRGHAFMFGLTALIYFAFSYIDRFGNWYQVIMPMYPLLLLGAGVSLDRLWRARSGQIGRLAVPALLIALVLFKAAESYPTANQRNRPEHTGLGPGWAVLAAQPPAHAAIIASMEQKLALDYLTHIWGLRPDVRAVSTGEAAAALQAGRPLLVTRAAAAYAAAESGLALRYSSWGPGLLLAAAGRMPDAHLAGLASMNQPLGDGLRLVGFDLATGPEPDVWRVTVAMQADAAPVFDWSLSVRPQAAGMELAQQDHPSPAAGFTPTSSLAAGDVVLDAFRFELPGAAPPDGVRLIVYRQLADASFENLMILSLRIR